MRLAWAWSVAIALCGCASSPPPPAQPVVEEVVDITIPQRSDLVCTVERPTGSQIASRQCVSRAVAARVTEASQEWMRSGGSHGSPIYVRDPADPRDTDENARGARLRFGTL